MKKSGTESNLEYKKNVPYFGKGEREEEGGGAGRDGEGKKRGGGERKRRMLWGIDTKMLQTNKKPYILVMRLGEFFLTFCISVFGNF